MRILLEWLYVYLQVNVDLIGSLPIGLKQQRNEKNISPSLPRRGRGEVLVIFPKPLLPPPLSKGRQSEGEAEKIDIKMLIIFSESVSNP